MLINRAVWNPAARTAERHLTVLLVLMATQAAIFRVSMNKQFGGRMLWPNPACHRFDAGGIPTILAVQSGLRLAFALG
jgi:hypothetical protein